MNPSPKSRTSRWLRTSVAVSVAALGLGGAGAGCLTRPLAKQTPNTTNVFIDQFNQDRVDKIDLLFMVDNSISMADKQVLLGKAVPKLVERLVTPFCVNPDDASVAPTAPPPGGCVSPLQQEFSPINDIHIGVISSSLGSHGMESGICGKESDDDHAQLIGSVRSLPPGASYDANGFLFWGPEKGGESDANRLKANFTTHITATGESGCGFEAQLESWYRFLIDPQPPKKIVKTDGLHSGPERDGNGNIIVNETVLAQRAAFLRPDSLVAIVMLTDENDCSIVDSDGQGYLIGAPSLPRATSACNENPNSPCCLSCAVPTAPSGCTAPPDDVECKKGGYSAEEDNNNLRCWEQKRRFGFEMLYPTQRYVNALKMREICPASWDLSCGNGAIGVPNPLFQDLQNTGKPPRNPDLIFFAGIVGVPWQDIATDASRDNPGEPLKYLKASELMSKGRWVDLLGDASTNGVPRDPFMIESERPRQGAHPFLPGVSITPYGGQRNPVNGSEWDPQGADLQYACVYELETPRDCTNQSQGCDCYKSTEKPLCNSKTQTYAKAYPGSRELTVLRDFGKNAIVGSICPKQPLGDPNYDGYGYTPAVSAIIERLKEALSGRCLPRKLAKDADGEVACRLVESYDPALTGGSCAACDANLLRTDVSADVAKALRKQLKEKKLCGGVGLPACEALCLCEYMDPGDAAKQACLNDPNSSQPAWCYIDDPNSPLLKDCGSTEKQLLRLVSSDSNRLPAAGATLSFACLGDAISE